MKNWLGLLVALLFADSAIAANTYSGTLDGDKNHPPEIIYHRLTFDANTTESRALDVGTYCSATFVDGAGGDVAMWEVPTSGTTATSGTYKTTFTQTTNSPYTWKPGKGWVKFVPSSSALAATVTVTCAGGIASGGSGSGDSDTDGDGLYEAAVLWDADGDGSVEVTCTAKDTPDSACKAQGEVIYGDFADDLNCAMHGCGYGQMERNGSIYLKNAVVYVNFPCWEPTNVTNTRGGVTTDDEHDATSRAAWNLCPASPDPNTTRRLGAISIMGWQGEIIGGGMDTRNPATTANYKRDKGTYIVDDRGPAWRVFGSAGNCSSTWNGCNTWWGQSDFVRGINFGFDGGGVSTTDTFANSGEYAGDFDSLGFGTVSGTQTLDDMEASVCVTTANGLGSAEAGAVLLIYGTSDASGAFLSSSTVAAAVRVLDSTGTTCNGAGTERIYLGGAVGSVLSDNGKNMMNPPFIKQLTSGMTVVEARSDYFDTAARITNVNIEPQDWWNESGGDCLETGVWTLATDVDNTNPDIDCDTEPMVGIWGGNSGVATLDNVVFRNFHGYTIDGNSNAGTNRIRGVRFMYGNGGPTFDSGTGWVMEDIEVRESRYNNDVFSFFGPGSRFNDIRLYNVLANSVATLNGYITNSTFENINVYNSAITNHFYLTCGARQNTIRNVTISNIMGAGTTQLNGVAARLVCTDTAHPIEQNVFDDFKLTGTGYANYSSINPDQSLAIVVFDTGAVIGTSNAAAIKRNSFSHLQYKMTETAAAFDACMFAVQDNQASGNRTTSTDYSLEQVLAFNTFFGNTIDNSGSGTDLMYCDCNLEDGSLPAGGFDSCADAIKGGGASGYNARGCMNFDDSAAPANETCS